jgi:hypothetical protein
MKRKTKTIGQGPLDDVLPRDSGNNDQEPIVPIKERATFMLSADVMDRLRNVVFWTPGATMSELVEQAISRAVEREEKERGEPFPRRTRTLLSGRPVRK